MRRTVVALLLLTAFVGSALAQETPKPRLIHGFESKDEIAGFDREGVSLSLTMQPEQVTQGKSALAVTFKAAPKGYPGIHIRGRGRLRGWEKYDLLAMDVTHLGDKPVGLNFRFDDAQTKNYETRAHASKLLRPGRNAVAIPLKSLRRVNKARFNVATLKMVAIFLGNPKTDIQLVLDNIRLTKEVAVRIDVPDAHLFDFSGDGGMVFPGFVKVHPSVPYHPQRGHGFLSSQGLIGTDDQFPDTLAGDSICHGSYHWGNTPFTFRVDVPDARYRVGYVVHTPRFRDHSVKFADYEDKVAWTAKKLFSEKGIYLGLNHDYHPGKDIWQAYVQAAWPWRWTDVDVKGGKLEVTVQYASIAALIVYPVSQQRRMGAVLGRIEKSRREKFEQEAFLLTMPRANARPPAPTAAQQKAGVILFYPRRTDTVTCATVPTKDTAGTGLTLAAARGQREPATLAIYPLRNAHTFTATTTALKGPNGAAIPAKRIDVRLVRHFIRKNKNGTWSPKPTQLVPARGKLYRGFTRQLWVIVDVPADAAPGRYQGSLMLEADNAQRSVQAVPLALTVHPFNLPASSRAAFACYFSGPMEARYITRFKAAAPLTFEQALDRQFIDMKRHGFNAVQLPQPQAVWVDAATQRYKLGFDTLEVYVKLMKKHGFRTDACQMATSNLANRLLRLKYREFSPQFNTVLKNSVAAIDRWFKDRGVSILFWPVDEPREQGINPWNRNLRDTLRYLKLYGEVPGVRTTVTPMGDANFGADYTPMVKEMDVIQTHPWPASKKMMAMARAAKRPELWLYNAGVDRLSYGLYVWKAKALGRWQWHYQWGDTSYNPFLGYHWAVAWPGLAGIVSSVGYEQVAMGIVDYKYVELLEGLIAKAEKAGTAVDSTKQLLAKIEAVIPEWPVKGMGDGTDVGETYAGGVNAQLDGWRTELAAEIIKLQNTLRK